MAKFNRRDSSDKFSKDKPRFSRDSPRFNRRDSSREQKMHRVTCDKCKKKCEVPFLPTESKPVYCSNCFRKDGGSKSNGNDGLLKEINKKLDRILKGLDL